MGVMTDETITQKLATPDQRVKFVVDDDPDLSWLEQEEFADENADDLIRDYHGATIIESKVTA